MGYAEIIKKKMKEWEAPDMMNVKNSGAKIPFSSPLLNYATYGGIPRNAMTEFFGQPGGGKSTSAIDICKKAYQLFSKEHEKAVEDLRLKISSGHKEYAGPLEDLIERGPKKVLYIDLEHSFDDNWSNVLGVNRKEIDIMQPPDIAAEQITQMIQDLTETGEIGIIVVDSIPSLVTQAEMDKKYGERTVSSLAGLMTTFTRKMTPLCSRYETTILLINQVRDNMDNPYIVSTPGGQAIKFYCSLRIQFNIGSPVDFLGHELPKSTENPAGSIINAKIVKQKSAPFDRKNASYFLMSASGIRPDFDFAKLAIEKYGIIRKAGAWFSLCDPSTGEILTNEDGSPKKLNGLAKVYDYLNANQEYFNRVRTYIESDINGGDPLAALQQLDAAENDEYDESQEIEPVIEETEKEQKSENLPNDIKEEDKEDGKQQDSI